MDMSLYHNTSFKSYLSEELKDGAIVLVDMSLYHNTSFKSYSSEELKDSTNGQY